MSVFEFEEIFRIVDGILILVERMDQISMETSQHTLQKIEKNRIVKRRTDGHPTHFMRSSRRGDLITVLI